MSDVTDLEPADAPDPPVSEPAGRGTPPPGTTGHDTPASRHGVYLYAICRSGTAHDLADTPGVRGTSVRLLEAGELSAVVSTVDLEEFGEAGLQRNLEDLSWLEAVARAHNAVVAACFRSGVVAPVSLATVFLDDAAVLDRLRGWREQVGEALARVEGSCEMGVKVHRRNQATPIEPAAGSPDGGTTAPGAGAAYLERLRSAAARRETAARALNEAVHELHAQLAAQTVASRRHPVQDPRLTGHEGQMVLNAAYLVVDVELDAFPRRVTALAERHPDLEFEVTGPWPPYSFVTLEAS